MVNKRILGLGTVTADPGNLPPLTKSPRDFYGKGTMGYTHYWTQKRAFTDAEWKLLLGEAKRLIAKAARGHYYSGQEDAASQDSLLDEQGCRHGFKEEGAWRTFPHSDAPVPCQGEPIPLAGPKGTGKPHLSKHIIALNGRRPHDYESFVLGKEPPTRVNDRQEPDGLTNFCKTEYRPYDAVVVSILAVARFIAPGAITVSSDGGDKAIRYLF